MALRLGCHQILLAGEYLSPGGSFSSHFSPRAWQRLPLRLQQAETLRVAANGTEPRRSRKIKEMKVRADDTNWESQHEFQIPAQSSESTSPSRQI